MKGNNRIKTQEQKKLKIYDQYNSLVKTRAFTLIMMIILLFCSYNFKANKINTICALIAGIYILEFIFMAFSNAILKRSILRTGSISKTIKLLGAIMTIFVLTGNVFAFLTGMLFISENKSIEYKLCGYMILVNICIIMVSLVNLFKETVVDTFYIGIGIVSVFTVVYIVCTVIIEKNVTMNTFNKKIIWVCIPLVISLVTANVFTLVLIIILIKRYYQKNQEITIQWVDIMRRLFKNETAVIGLLIVAFFLSLSFCSRLTFDYNLAIDNEYSKLLQSPSLQYPFGTDNYGRCVFTRIVFGARISLLVGLGVTTYPMIIGGILGALAGYYPGKVDNIVMRFLDILGAVPGLLLSIVIIAALGASVPVMIFAIGVPGIGSYARLVRASVMNLVDAEFIEAAKAYGAKDRVIVFKHVIPNSLSPIVVNATSALGGAVLATSGLSYLGIGLPTHLPEWGNILRVGNTYLETHPYLAVYPGVAIVVLCLAFNFFGDGVRDALDPKLK